MGGRASGCRKTSAVASKHLLERRARTVLESLQVRDDLFFRGPVIADAQLAQTRPRQPAEGVVFVQVRSIVVVPDLLDAGERAVAGVVVAVSVPIRGLAGDLEIERLDAPVQVQPVVGARGTEGLVCNLRNDQRTFSPFLKYNRRV